MHCDFCRCADEVQSLNPAFHWWVGAKNALLTQSRHMISKQSLPSSSFTVLAEEHKIAVLMRSALRHALPGDVRVTVNEKAVFMHGVVPYWHQKQLAQECVRRLAAGRLIDNRVAVKRLADDSA